LLRDGVPVETGDKIGDIDPRGVTDDIWHISDKAMRVAEGVHEALVLHSSRIRSCNVAETPVVSALQG
jgi:xanthine dehydrogenase accessory factor